MASRNFETAQQLVAEDLAAVYSYIFTAEQFGGTSLCSVLLKHSRLVFDTGQLSNAHVEVDHVTATELGSHIQDVALNMDHRLVNRTEVDEQISEFCPMAEPSLLRSLHDLETNDRALSVPAIIVADTHGEPLGIIKHRGDRSLYALSDANGLVLGVGSWYAPFYERRAPKKTSRPDIQVLEQKNIDKLLPGRISTFVAGPQDLKGYDPVQIYNSRNLHTAERRKWKELTTYSRQVCKTDHRTVAARIHNIVDNL